MSVAVVTQCFAVSEVRCAKCFIFKMTSNLQDLPTRGKKKNQKKTLERNLATQYKKKKKK